MKIMFALDAAVSLRAATAAMSAVLPTSAAFRVVIDQFSFLAAGKTQGTHSIQFTHGRRQLSAPPLS